MRNSVSRIWAGAEELRAGGFLSQPSHGRGSSAELWMLLVIRMVTRASEPARRESGDNEKKEEKKGESVDAEMDFYVRQDKLRQVLCNYIMSAFPSR